MALNGRRLLACGMAAGPVFVSTYTADGRTRPHYQPRRHPVSALALGPRGWVQVANFLVTGPLTVAAAFGLRRSFGRGPAGTVVPLAVGAAGVGLVGAGVFATDPVPGYPDPDSTLPPARGPRSALMPPAVTRTGALHMLSAVPFFVGFPVAELSAARRFGAEGKRGLAGFSVAAAVSGMAAVTLSSVGFAGKEPIARRAGTWQRASVVAAFAWLAGVCGRARAGR